MTAYTRLACLKPQANDNSNRITIEWVGVSYKVNQRVLKRYRTTQDLIDAVTNFLGYWPDDLWVHLNRDGTWAIATGPVPPDVWPEDYPPDEVFP